MGSRGEILFTSGGQGSVVGKVDAQINLTADGKGIGDFATAGTVATVAVAAGQTVPIGSPADIAFTAKDSSGTDLALTPGSATVQIVSGSNLLSINSQGQAVGNMAGTATIHVTVDGKVSQDQTVNVSYVPSITISPATATIFANGQQGFEVKVDGVPAQQTGVTWSVQESDSGGTIVAGSYAAPNTPGTYHVVAASQFDATKRAIAIVTVTGPAAHNLPDIYVYDFNRLVHMNDLTGAGWGATPVVSPVFAIGPDGKLYFIFNNQIVRVDDLSGSNRQTFGTQGSGVGQFQFPGGMTIGPDGEIYVADSGNNRIVRMDDMNGTNWTTWVNSNHIGGSPSSVFVTTDHHIYFAGGNDSVGRIDDMTGTGLAHLDINDARRPFVSADGRIYSAGLGTITRFDDISGAGVVTFGGPVGNGTGRFGQNVSVWVGSSGQIYIADTDNHRIVRMDDMTGKNWTTLGTEGISNGEFESPSQIVVR